MAGKANVPKTWANHGARVITCQCPGQYRHEIVTLVRWTRTPASLADFKACRLLSILKEWTEFETNLRGTGANRFYTLNTAPVFQSESWLLEIWCHGKIEFGRIDGLMPQVAPKVIEHEAQRATRKLEEPTVQWQDVIRIDHGWHTDPSILVI